MSDQEKPAADDREEKLRKRFEDVLFDKERWQGRGTDWFLQWAVKFFDDMNLSAGLTLTVGGVLISGEAISSKAYFELVAEELSTPFEKFSEQAAVSMKDLLLSFRDPEADELSPLAAQYVHLKNAKFFAGPNATLNHGTLWRGKISAVEGFTFGELSVRK